MFYQHQPLVYWTSDRGLWRAAGMPSLLPRPVRSFYHCQTWGTKGSAQIRHLHTRHQGVMSHKEMYEAKLFDAGLLKETSHKRWPADWLVEQFFRSLINTTFHCFCYNTVCKAAWAYIWDKYRVDLTGVISFTICCVLWCWQCCWCSQMPSCRGGRDTCFFCWQFATSKSWHTGNQKV